MIEPFLKGSRFLQLPLGEKENEKEKYFTKKSVKSIFISQTFTSWNSAVPFSLNTFDLPQTLQLKSLIT